MKKYLVDVYLPAAGEHFDVRLPTGKRVREAVELLGLLAEPLTNGNYQPGSSSMLLDAQTGQQLPMDVTVHDAGVRNASRLILV